MGESCQAHPSRLRATSVSWATCAQPVAVRQAEEAAKPQIGVNCGRALAGRNVADALRRESSPFGAACCLLEALVRRAVEMPRHPGMGK